MLGPQRSESEEMIADPSKLLQKATEGCNPALKLNSWTNERITEISNFPMLASTGQDHRGHISSRNMLNGSVSNNHTSSNPRPVLEEKISKDVQNIDRLEKFSSHLCSEDEIEQKEESARPRNCCSQAQ